MNAHRLNGDQFLDRFLKQRAYNRWNEVLPITFHLALEAEIPR